MIDNEIFSIVKIAYLKERSFPLENFNEELSLNYKNLISEREKERERLSTLLQTIDKNAYIQTC